MNQPIAPTRTKFALTHGRGLSMSNGGQTLDLDVHVNEDGSASVKIGLPFCVSVIVRKFNGRRKYLIEAPEATEVRRAS